MVDHETRRVPQAVRAETRAVSVARHHKEVHVSGDGGNDLALGAALSVKELGVRPPEPPRRSGQDVQSRLVSDFAGGRPGFVPGKGASQKARRGRLRDLVDIR